jgi:hypothetical protein
MAVVRPTHHGRARRGLRELSPARANIDMPSHPTLADIADRQKEIELWEALNVGGYWFAKPGTFIGSLICIVMVVLAVTPIPPNWPWNIPLVILATFTAVGTGICGLLWFDNPRPSPCPEVLEIAPFKRAENLDLMREQPIELFQANCICPGCGDTATHRIREPVDGEPGWAVAVRRCAVCEREWAQV